MRRSMLENKYFKNKTPVNDKTYKKHKNYCSKLYKKERKKYFENLDCKNITDKKFWKTIKPLVSSKGVANQNITLVNGENIISDDTKVSETLNTFFQSAVQKLEIKENSYLLTDNSDVADPIDAIIKKIENHPSILTIKENVKPSSFMFTEVSLLTHNREYWNAVSSVVVAGFFSRKRANNTLTRK